MLVRGEVAERQLPPARDLVAVGELPRDPLGDIVTDPGLVEIPEVTEGSSP